MRLHRVEVGFPLPPSRLFVPQLLAPDIAELGVLSPIFVFVFRLVLLQRVFAYEGIADGQRGDDGDHVGEAVVLHPERQHFPEPRCERKGRHRPSHLVDRPTFPPRGPLPVQGPQTDKGPFRPFQRVSFWGCREREVHDLVDVHRLHLKHDTVDRRPEDFGWRVRGEVMLVQRGRVEPIAVSWSSTSRTPCALGGGGFGDEGNRVRLNAGRRVVGAL